MKNLFYSLCLLIGFSSWATPIDSQILSLNLNDIEKNISKTPDCQLDAFFKVYEENFSDESFDFDIKNYLPENFNAYAELFDAYDNANAEADEAFDFDTATYLPVGFNATLVIDTEAYDAANIEEDAIFDFTTANYLPLGFNANASIYDSIEEIAINEVDEPFDFNTEDYLTNKFDPHATEAYTLSMYYVCCIILMSI